MNRDQCEDALRDMLATINRVPVNRWHTSTIVWINHVHADLYQKLALSTLMVRGWITWTATEFGPIRRCQLTDLGRTHLDNYVDFTDDDQWREFLGVAFRVDNQEITGGGRD